MDTPAHTLNYMIAGFIVFFSVTIAYLVNLNLRWRAARRELELLDTLEQKPSQD